MARVLGLLGWLSLVLMGAPGDLVGVAAVVALAVAVLVVVWPVDVAPVVGVRARVFGGAVGLLLPPTYWIGFLVVSILLGFGLAQTILSRQGLTLIPGIGGNRPVYPRRTAVP